MDQKSFSENIRSFRIANQLTQAEVARRLFVTPQTVSKWENGTAFPDLENFCSLVEILHTTPDRLLGVGKQEESLFLGIDVGGTKTDLALFRKDGSILRRKIVPGANPNSCGLENAVEIIADGIQQICADYTVSGVFAGISGITVGENASKMLSAFRKRFPGIPFTLGSDIENVIFSVPNAEKCIAVICGTGSVVFAWDGTKAKRIGGYGYIFDQKGSGYDIGRDALTACLEADDGLRPHSELTRLVHQKLGATPWEKLNELMTGGRDQIAQFSPLVFEASQKGDATAEQIIDENLSRLIRLIKHAKESYDCGDTVVCAGGNTKDPGFRRYFEEHGVSPVIPQLPPVYGACVRCITLYGTQQNQEEFQHNFIKTLN